MKVTHYSGDSIGGAARAAIRLHQAMQSNMEIESAMIVREKTNDDWRINVPYKNQFESVYGQILPFIDRMPARLQRSEQVIPRSPAWVSAIRAKEINRSEADVVNLHWICSGFLSIEEIGKITKPIVWTLHDMWSFCGAEHLAEDVAQARWRVGYKEESRYPQDHWLDIDKWVWRRKQTSWIKPMRLVTPSVWLAECVCASELMRNWVVTVIPNVLDTLKYHPISKHLARKILGLPLQDKLIAFGAIQGTQLAYKGWDLLQPALAKVAKIMPTAHAVIFGQGEPKNPPSIGLIFHWLGHLHDDATLALLYSAVDVVVVPSRQESFGQTASEAHACGTPVVAFNATGLRDVVEHGVTGYLAEPYRSDDLANGIVWVLENKDRQAILSIEARKRAVRLWSHDAIVPQYKDVYQQVIEGLK